MRSATPLFSVVLTTSDRPAMLRDAADSVLSQTGDDFELLIIDDGMIAPCVAELLADPRVVYLNKRNLRPGVASSRNLGIDLARGSYLCFLDDDDLFLPGFLAAAREAVISSPGKLLFGNFDLVEETLEGAARVVTGRRHKSIAEADVASLSVVNFIPICAVIVPRLPDLPRFDPSLPSHEDWEFLLACARRCAFVGLPLTVCEVRQRTSVPADHRGKSRQAFWWMDFLAVYQRHPRPELAQARVAMLRSLGAELPQIVLENLGRHSEAQ